MSRSSSAAAWRLHVWADASLEGPMRCEGVVAVGGDELGDPSNSPNLDKLRYRFRDRVGEGYRRLLARGRRARSRPAHGLAGFEVSSGRQLMMTPHDAAFMSLDLAESVKSQSGQAVATIDYAVELVGWWEETIPELRVAAAQWEGSMPA